MRPAIVIALLVVLASPCAAQHPWFAIAPDVRAHPRVVAAVADPVVIVPAKPPSRWWTFGKTLGSIGVGGSTVYDGLQSNWTIRAGAATEANAIVRNENGTVNWPVKAGISVAQQGAGWYFFRKGHRWPVLVADAITTGLYLWLGKRASNQRRDFARRVEMSRMP